MTDSRVAIFLLDDTLPQSPFLGWASLIGPQVTLLHGLVDVDDVPSGSRCRCAIYSDGNQDPYETIDGDVARAASLKKAPPFVFLDTRARSPITEMTDPRLYASDKRTVKRAVADFVAAQVETDPPPLAEGGPAEGALGPGQLRGENPLPDGQESSAYVLMGGTRPWWCKLFRTAPGCG